MPTGLKRMSQSAFTCSNLTIETLEEGVKLKIEPLEEGLKYDQS